MRIYDEIVDDLRRLFRMVADETPDDSILEDICKHLNVSRMSYEVDYGEENRYRDPHIIQGIMGKEIVDGRTVIFDDGEKTDLRLVFPFYFQGRVFVKSYLEFRRGITEKNLDMEIMQFVSDVMCVLISRRNMMYMLELAETTDAQTGIPNLLFLHREYNRIVNVIPPEEMVVIRVNLRNFKYINEAAGARAGDEAINQYSHKLKNFVGENECVCRLGGDNFVIAVKKENMDILVEKMQYVHISGLRSAPGQNFNVSAWMGVSIIEKGDKKTFIDRMNDASIACDLAKGRFRKSQVIFDDSLVQMINQGREIISIFKPAIRNHEFHPFFQPKVNMTDGTLVGFEALSRWIHNGHFIYPDQFIPVLDKNALIPDLDMAIFRETCAAVRQWKNMGLNPPLVSSNFSKKNLFVPRIVEKIFQTIEEFDLTPDEMEIEITESLNEVEYEPLMQFVKDLKSKGLHISVDDFGTGYSSLSLLHNIEADVIKIDRSFVDKLPGDERSKILIESIIDIARRLGMSVVAEGVESEEQGRTLIGLGCSIAQGYFYSKPVDFDTATKFVEEPGFKILNI